MIFDFFEYFSSFAAQISVKKGRDRFITIFVDMTLHLFYLEWIEVLQNGYYLVYNRFILEFLHHVLPQ